MQSDNEKIYNHSIYYIHMNMCIDTNMYICIIHVYIYIYIYIYVYTLLHSPDILDGSELLSTSVATVLT